MIAVPVLVFVLNWARPQPLGVMRTMAAKECGAGGVLTVPHHMGPRVTTGVGKAMYWTVDRRGEMVVDVMKAGVGVEINGTVGMVKTGFERMEGFKVS